LQKVGNLGGYNPLKRQIYGCNQVCNLLKIVAKMIKNCPKSSENPPEIPRKSPREIPENPEIFHSAKTTFHVCILVFFRGFSGEKFRENFRKFWKISKISKKSRNFRDPTTLENTLFHTCLQPGNFSKKFRLKHTALFLGDIEK
jgi:hypothetical protein